jgi:RsiW-degrading membrane proteinase PrsW (M82 family)/uncharacterized protein YbaR (Trm112 family)
MIFLLLLALGLAPGVFWLAYFYKKDKLEPEPKKLVLKTALFGIIAVIPVYLIEMMLSTTDAIDAVIAAPVIEEGAKLLAVFVAVYSNPEFDEPLDGLIYGAAAALGFASIENALYLYKEYENADGSAPLVLIVRSLLSVPGHVLFSSLWAGALGRAKFLDQKTRRRVIGKGLLWAMGAHALFNLLAVLNLVWAMAFILLPRFWRHFNADVEQLTGLSPFKPLQVEASGSESNATSHNSSSQVFCGSCGSLLELSRDELLSGSFVCPTCSHRNQTSQENSAPTEESAQTNSHYLLQRFVACPECKTELELGKMERAKGEFVCPACNNRYEMDGVGNAATVAQFILPEKPICPSCGGEQTLDVSARAAQQYTCRHCNQVIENVEE